MGKCGRMRLTIGYIRREFEDRGCKLLSKKYVNGKKLEYICPNGNKRSIRWVHFKNGKVNIFNAGKPKISIEQVKTEFAEFGYTLLTGGYINSRQKLKYKCDHGHIHFTTRNNWLTGYRCPECQPNMKKTIEFSKEEVEKVGHKLITTEYINHHQKLHTVCSKGHDCFITWSNLQQHFSGCPICKEWGTSNQEKDLISFIKSVCDNVIVHNRELIKPYELDIVIPNKKIAIEYCGLYWHSEMMGKDKNYHLKKTELCKKVGYKLVTIFEDELVYKKDTVFLKLKSLLCDDVLFDENYQVHSINKQIASDFCNNNHINGYNKEAIINLGVFNQYDLRAVMAFSLKKGIYKLLRFCFKENHNQVGMANKLLKHFINEHGDQLIFFCADRRWQDSIFYRDIGFRFSQYTKPNYW